MLILIGLLAAYLGGALQDSLLDNMHFVSHLAQEFTAELQHTYYNHQHQDGQAHTHRHIVLEVIDDTLDNTENDALPQGDQQKNLKKKNPEQRSTIDPIALFIFFEPDKSPYRVYPVLKVFTATPTPPPKDLNPAYPLGYT